MPNQLNSYQGISSFFLTSALYFAVVRIRSIVQIPVTSRLDGPISTSYDVWMPSQQKDLVQLVHQKYSLIHLSKTIGESSWSLDCDVSMEEITGSTARRAQMREQELTIFFFKRP